MQPTTMKINSLSRKRPREFRWEEQEEQEEAATAAPAGGVIPEQEEVPDNSILFRRKRAKIEIDTSAVSVSMMIHEKYPSPITKKKYYKSLLRQRILTTSYQKRLGVNNIRSSSNSCHYLYQERITLLQSPLFL